MNEIEKNEAVKEVVEVVAEEAIENAKEGKIGVAGFGLIIFAGIGVGYVVTKAVSGTKKVYKKITDAREAKLALKVANEVINDEVASDEDDEN